MRKCDKLCNKKVLCVNKSMTVSSHMGRMTGAFTWPSLLRCSWNANQTCHYESNHCCPCWMCSAWTVCTPSTRRGSRDAAEDDPRPSILQLNTEGLTANKICIIEQLAYKNKAFIIVLQETHCITRLPSLNQRRIFIFGDLGYFKLGAFWKVCDDWCHTN